MRSTKGRRAYPDADGDLWLKDCEYGYDTKNSRWLIRPPGMHHGNLSNHEVTEHEDGTITVRPSILIEYPLQSGEKKRWHGYLERGVWREV